jgi:hypothetical protein
MGAQYYKNPPVGGIWEMGNRIVAASCIGDKIWRLISKKRKNRLLLATFETD